MKTPDEIKKGLTWCIKGDYCKGCPYEDDCYVNLRNTPMVKEAFAYIQQLEANHSKVKAELKRLTQNHIEDMKIICKLERERDAAIELLRGACALCKNDKPENEDDLCFRCKWGYGCTSGDFWEFNGVFPDTEVSHDA